MNVMQEQILALNKTVGEYERNLEERNQRLKETIKMLEIEKFKHENLAIQYANSTSEIKSFKESFQEKEVFLNEQVRLLCPKNVKSLSVRCSKKFSFQWE